MVNSRSLSRFLPLLGRDEDPLKKVLRVSLMSKRNNLNSHDLRPQGTFPRLVDDHFPPHDKERGANSMVGAASREFAKCISPFQSWSIVSYRPI